MSEAETPTFSKDQVSIAGGPTITFEFEGAKCRAVVAGATLTADALGPDRANLSIVDAHGDALADLMVRKIDSDESITVTVMRVGSALLWSYARWADAKATESPPEFASAT